MFNPATAAINKVQKNAKKKALASIKEWCVDLVPTALQAGLTIDVNEVACGDPSCAPIDTVFTIVWENGGKGVFAIPCTAAEIEQSDLTEFFPDEYTLRLWHSGRRARWPPLPELRFKVADRVECRVGPHPIKGWAPGRIVKLHYSEPNWPPNMVAPYQIALHDGRLIFAPQDTDMVIRLRPPPAPDAPSSPEFFTKEEGEWEDEEDINGEDGYRDYGEKGVVENDSKGST